MARLLWFTLFGGFCFRDLIFEVNAVTVNCGYARCPLRATQWLSLCGVPFVAYCAFHAEEIKYFLSVGANSKLNVVNSNGRLKHWDRSVVLNG